MGKTPDFDFRESNKNLIINGDMRIDQRFAGGAISAVNLTGYTVDRWTYSASQTLKFNAGQNQLGFTPPEGFQKYFNLNSLSAYSLLIGDFFTWLQFIEGFNSAHLMWGTENAKPITISFWTRSSLTGMFGGALRNFNSTRSYPFSYTISVANTWEYKTVTIPGDISGVWQTDSQRGITIFFNLGSGVTLSGPANAWASASYTTPTGTVSVVSVNGANWNVTGVQLNEGNVAALFDRRSFGKELHLCQRYYAKTYEIDTAPASAGALGGIATSYAYTTAAQTSSANWKLPVRMRAAPTVAIYNASTGATGTWNDTGGASIAVQIQNQSQMNAYLINTGSMAAGRYCAGHLIADAEL